MDSNNKVEQKFKSKFRKLQLSPDANAVAEFMRLNGCRMSELCKLKVGNNVC